MNWRLLIVLVILLPATACRLEESNDRFSSNVPAATFAPLGMRPNTLEVAELMENPAAYAGTAVQVSGEYRRLPVLVCEGRARRSPATWLLQGEGAQIGATGYDNLLQRLLPNGFDITVSGRWQHWQGAVGCGKEAPVQEVWYLAVDEIVAPMPLARITVTPGGVATSENDNPTPDANGTLPSAPTATLEPVQTPTLNSAYPAGTLAPTLITPKATATRAATVSGTTPAPAASVTPELTTATASPGATRGAGTPSPTPETSPSATIPGSQATATPDGTPTPTATTEGTPVTITDKGALPLMGLSDFPDLALVMDRIGENEAHRWQFDVEAGETITVSAVAMPATNIRLEIQDANDNVLVSQDDQPAGSVEIIAGVAVDNNSTWQVVVYETGRQVTYYGLLLNKSTYSSDSYYTLGGLVAYNQNQAAALPPETDQIWFFPGEAGDSVSINVAPQDSSDLIFQFYGPAGQALLNEFKNDGGGGDSEIQLNYELPDDGLYGIHVGEFDFGAANYTLTVSSQ